MVIREIAKNEYDQLRSTWCEVFGDDPDFVDELYYNMKATGYTVEDEGELHSFLTLFEAGELYGRKVKVSYGICTRAESRGKGYAGELVKHVRDLVTSEGSISLICPAEPSLVDFYSNLGYEPTFFAGNLESRDSDDICTDSDFDPSAGTVSIKMISSKEYNRFREAFLADIPHVSFNDRFMEFVKNDSVNAQGMLLINGGDAICTINYGNDEEMGISELLVDSQLESVTSEISEELASGLAQLFEVGNAYYRKPTSIVYTDKSGDCYSRGTYVQAMTAGLGEDINTAEQLPYYGFPID